MDTKILKIEVTFHFIAGLVSLTMLDLSYNSIISLGPASLSGLSR